MDQDREYLRILSIFHYVVGGLIALFGSFPLIHVAIGIAMISNLLPEPHEPPPPELPGGLDPGQFFGLVFALLGGVFVLLAWTVAALVLYAGRCLATYRRYTFCLVVAGIECLCFPFGTVLGVFTIVVLIRPSVKQLFGVWQAAQ